MLNKEARDKRLEARDKKQETRGKTQEPENRKCYLQRDLNLASCLLLLPSFLLFLTLIPSSMRLFPLSALALAPRPVFARFFRGFRRSPSKSGKTWAWTLRGCRCHRGRDGLFESRLRWLGFCGSERSRGAQKRVRTQFGLPLETASSCRNAQL